MKRRHTTRRDVQRLLKQMNLHINSMLIHNEIINRHTRAMLYGTMDVASVRHILHRSSEAIDWHHAEVMRLSEELDRRLAGKRKGGEA